jgi:hypothetical protein
MAGGCSLNSRSTIWLEDVSTTEYLSGNGEIINSFGNYSDNTRIETFDYKRVWGVSAYLPLGADFRIGNNGGMLDKFHLFVELRPGVIQTSVPDLRSYVQTSLISSLGMKVSLN